VYYELIQLFSKGQMEANREIIFLCRVLRVYRICLGVYASSRGSLAGRLLMKNNVGQWQDCSRIGNQGKTICGDMSDLSRCIQSDARYIVCIEKQGVFDELCQAYMFNCIPCILITAHGVPDMASRALTSRLSRDLQVPVLVIADWNPGAIQVLLAYRFGSTKQLLQGGQFACKNLYWLGLHARDIVKCAKDSLIPMSDKDVRRLRLLQESPLTQSPLIQKQLQLMLQLGVRCELQALRFNSTNTQQLATPIAQWVLKKIVHKQWIAI